MPSTHVVYEGMKDVQEDIQENKQTCPELAYGKSKDFNEKQLKSSGKNYIILRLGSVYGYSSDTARIDIMTNLFSKLHSAVIFLTENSLFISQILTALSLFAAIVASALLSNSMPLNGAL